jgi:uncharacterized protein YgbK (DUF1537 family)
LSVASTPTIVAIPMSDFFLADDLSGALDAAAAFHRVGRRVRIALSPTGWSEAGPEELLGLNTETRNARPENAGRIVAAAIAAGRAQGRRLVYKKIDSTLRGPVAAELAALRAAWPEAQVLFAPANPRVGRTVQGGILRVNGVPVAETEFGRDPASPVRHSVIRELLGAAADAHVTIPDASTEADLAAAARQMDANPQPWVGVGSGALAFEAAARCCPSTPAPVVVPEIAKSPILLVGGSAHPRNREQAAELRIARGVPIHEVDPTGPATMSVGSAEAHAGGSLTLLLPTARMDPTKALQAISATAATLAASHRLHRIFATGGDTAFAVATQLGIRSLLYLAEVEPGLGIALGCSRIGTVLFAIKPGGFGDPQSWLRAFDRLAAL